MFRYLQGRLNEAKELMQENIRDGFYVVEQAGFLAKIALAEKDTNAAIAAYDDFLISTLSVYPGCISSSKFNYVNRRKAFARFATNRPPDS